MKYYNGFGKEGMSFEEAMDLLKDNVENLDEYVMDLLFDITMEEVDDPITDTRKHNRS